MDTLHLSRPILGYSTGTTTTGTTYYDWAGSWGQLFSTGSCLGLDVDYAAGIVYAAGILGLETTTSLLYDVAMHTLKQLTMLLYNVCMHTLKSITNRPIRRYTIWAYSGSYMMMVPWFQSC